MFFFIIIHVLIGPGFCIANALVFLKLCALTAADVCLMLFLIYIYI